MKRQALVALLVVWFAGGACEMNGPPPGFDVDALFSNTVPNQDVIPINGDSSDPVDDVMDDAPSPRPAAFHAWAFSAPDASPVTLYSRRDDGDVEISVISPNGVSAADFQRRMSAPIVLMPLADKSRDAIERYVANTARRGSGVHVTRARLHAYCVEANKPPAAAKSFYAIAPSRIADQFASVQGLLRVADRAVADGILKPQGDPQAYGRFIAQYAAWTKLERWDQKAFTDQFVQRTRQAAEARHGAWSTETEQTLRALAPNRWADVQRVMKVADSTTGGGAQ